MAANLKNIIVVGSGGGGIILAQTLQKQINPATHRIVVIEKRDYYAHWPALIRAAITDEGSIDERALVPTDRVFNSNTRIIRSSAKEITPTEVITESGESVPYEHLVLATGSIWSGPLALPDSREKAVEHFKSFKRELGAAKHVLIIGGSATGIEYAGELVHYHPDKKVTIVHGGKELMNSSYPSKFRTSLLKAMTSKGVEVILGDKVPSKAVPEGGYVTTEGGKRIRADIIIVAAGGRPNASVVKTLDPEAVTGHGTVLVTPELRVKLSSGAQNVWAIGDIIEWAEQKARNPVDEMHNSTYPLLVQMVFKAGYGHAPTVAKNILASIQGGKFTQYEGKPEIIFVTLGPKGGRGIIPFFGGIVIGDWIVGWLKSSELFVSKARASLGY